MLNDHVMDRLQGTMYEFKSADSVTQSENDGAVYTTEFLNTLELSGLPPHLLKVRIGCVMMLLRNLDPRAGLCNGTRFVLTSVTKYIMQGLIITGTCTPNQRTD